MKANAETFLIFSILHGLEIRLCVLGQIKNEDVDVFLKGGGALDITSIQKKPKVSAILNE